MQTLEKKPSSVLISVIFVMKRMTFTVSQFEIRVDANKNQAQILRQELRQLVKRKRWMEGKMCVV